MSTKNSEQLSINNRQESNPQNVKNINTKKNMTWAVLGMMAFTCVWSFGNIINGFGYFGGTGVIIPWILVFVLYFLPYSLIVGELGSVFKNAGGGVSSWIFETIGPKIAFFCGWIYWVVHLPYISQKPNTFLVSVSWIVFQEDKISSINPVIIQIGSLIVFLIAVLLSLKGLKIIKTISGIAGVSMLIMSLLYIMLIFAAPALSGKGFGSVDLTLENMVPKDSSVFLSLSVLILAVGGCEKISPYINQMKKPGKEFPMGMIFLVIMVVTCAILGTIAMGQMYDSAMLNNPEYQKWFIGQAQYDAFAQLGHHYGLGNLFLIVFCASNAIAQFAVLIISIDAPLKILLSNVDKKFVPKWWLKKNKNGSYVNGLKVLTVIVSILIIVPLFAGGNVNDIITSLVKLNSVCMPLRYLFVFIAYIALKRCIEKFDKPEFTFIKNKYFGMIVGGWCFFVTASCCIVGMYDPNPSYFLMNVLTPVILLGIGFVLPYFAKRERNKLKSSE